MPDQEKCLLIYIQVKSYFQKRDREKNMPVEKQVKCEKETYKGNANGQ